MEFKQWLISEMFHNEYLKHLLLSQAGGTVGKEKKKNLTQDISVYVDPHGSYRLVKFIDNNPVSVIQIMKKDKDGLVSNAYTLPEFRRQGFGRELLNAAKKMFLNLTFSDDRSGSGDAWAHGVNESTDIKFLSFNSYGDVTVLIGDKRYTYITRDGVIARKAFQLSKYAPWKMLNKLKKIDPNPKIT